MGENIVLETTKRLVENPKYVTIDDSVLNTVAKRFSQEELKIPTWEFPMYLEGNNESTIDFFLLGNSINFAFTDFETGQKYSAKEQKGSSGMWACLKKAFEAGIPILEGSYLQNISEKEVNNCGLKPTALSDGDSPIIVHKNRSMIFVLSYAVA